MITPRRWLALGSLLALAACGDDAGVVAVTDTVVPVDVEPGDAVVADSAPDRDSSLALDSASADTVADSDGSEADVRDAETDDAGPQDTEETDTTVACTPKPFVPQGAPTEWDHPIQTPITRALGAANHRGQDVVVAAGQPQVLIGKFAYGFTDKDLKEELVEVWLQPDPPCGEWRLMDTVRTSTDGQYGSQYGIEDDGGRVFYAIPPDQRLPVGRYPVRMLVRGDHSLASFDLVVVDPGTSAIVCDIDGTLTTDDGELITEIAQSIFNNTYDQQLRAGAVEALTAWYDKGYLVVYLTGRPDLLRPMTERWLVDHGFPPGPLHLTDTNGQVLPTNGGVGDYKTAYLAYLASQAGGVSVYAAYGNATTDIYAFGNAAIPKERTFIAGDHGGEEGTVDLGDDFQAHLPAAQAMPAATVPAPPANGWW